MKFNSHDAEPGKPSTHRALSLPRTRPAWQSGRPPPDTPLRLTQDLPQHRMRPVVHRQVKVHVEAVFGCILAGSAQDEAPFRSLHGVYGNLGYREKLLVGRLVGRHALPLDTVGCGGAYNNRNRATVKGMAVCGLGTAEID
jgi:hypothetical protein